MLGTFHVILPGISDLLKGTSGESALTSTAESLIVMLTALIQSHEGDNLHWDGFCSQKITFYNIMQKLLCLFLSQDMWRQKEKGDRRRNEADYYLLWQIFLSH